MGALQPRIGQPEAARAATSLARRDGPSVIRKPPAPHLGAPHAPQIQRVDAPPTHTPPGMAWMDDTSEAGAGSQSLRCAAIGGVTVMRRRQRSSRPVRTGLQRERPRPAIVCVIRTRCPIRTVVKWTSRRVWLGRLHGARREPRDGKPVSHFVLTRRAARPSVSREALAVHRAAGRGNTSPVLAPRQHAKGRR